MKVFEFENIPGLTNNVCFVIMPGRKMVMLGDNFGQFLPIHLSIFKEEVLNIPEGVDREVLIKRFCNKYKEMYYSYN